MLVKKIEDKIKLSWWVSFSTIIACLIICITTAVYAYKMVESSRKNIYILDNGVPLLAKQTDGQMNRPAEFKAHIDLFHSFFFSLTPDDKFIEYQMKKAMYMIDESGALQYNNLKEKGFFNSIISSSSVLTLQTDSIQLDFANKYFRYYGKQTIDRRSSRVVRSLITEGKLKEIPRSENNPHGVLITSWRTLENKDLQNVTKNSF
jgi:conjugative transposon TraK protein